MELFAPDVRSASLLAILSDSAFFGTPCHILQESRLSSLTCQACRIGSITPHMHATPHSSRIQTSCEPGLPSLTEAHAILMRHLPWIPSSEDPQETHGFLLHIVPFPVQHFSEKTIWDCNILSHIVTTFCKFNYRPPSSGLRSWCRSV